MHTFAASQVLQRCLQHHPHSGSQISACAHCTTLACTHLRVCCQPCLCAAITAPAHLAPPPHTYTVSRGSSSLQTSAVLLRILLHASYRNHCKSSRSFPGPWSRCMEIQICAHSTMLTVEGFRSLHTCPEASSTGSCKPMSCQATGHKPILHALLQGTRRGECCCKAPAGDTCSHDH